MRLSVARLAGLGGSGLAGPSQSAGRSQKSAVAVTRTTRLQHLPAPVRCRAPAALGRVQKREETAEHSMVKLSAGRFARGMIAVSEKSGEAREKWPEAMMR